MNRSNLTKVFGQLKEEELTKNEIKFVEALANGQDVLAISYESWAPNPNFNKIMESLCFKKFIINEFASLTSDACLLAVPCYSPNDEVISCPPEKVLPYWASEMLAHPDQHYILTMQPINDFPKEYVPWLRSLLNHQIGNQVINNYSVCVFTYDMENTPQTILDCFENVIDFGENISEAWDKFFIRNESKFAKTYSKTYIDKAKQMKMYWTNPYRVKRRVFCEYIDEFTPSMIESNILDYAVNPEYKDNPKVIQHVKELVSYIPNLMQD